MISRHFKAEIKYSYVGILSKYKILPSASQKAGIWCSWNYSELMKQKFNLLLFA